MSSPDAAQDASPSPEYSGDQDGDESMTEQQKDSAVKVEGDASPPQPKSANGAKANSKDPQRPRRKKARRACIACQRAHLTCGDERPCQRCVKRGLQDACQDGIRKKAKYLHDAPTEMLMPGVGGHYPHVNGGHSVPSSSASMPGTATSLAQPSTYYPPQVQPGSYEVYAQPPNQQMPPPPPSNSSFTGQPSPISPQFNPLGNQQSPQVPSIPQTQPQLNQFGGPIFDPSDPALFNFDIANLNFTNNYGALEFGMLSHMSSGAGDQSGADSNAFNLQGAMITPNYTDSSNILFPQDALMNVDWQSTHPRQNSTSQILTTPHNTPIATTIDAPFRQDGTNGHSNAYAIAAGPSSLASASPGSTGPDIGPPGYDNPSMSSPVVFSSTSQPQQTPSTQAAYSRPQAQQQQQTPKQSNKALQQHASAAKPPVSLSAVHKQHQAQFSRKRRRPVNDIYSQVTQPYEYTARFHTLFSYFRKNMPAEKLARIAKAIASFRPSLISLMEHLSEADLIHSEQCLMRQLLEYEEFIAATGTPTILIRRTGEVVLCNKEFSILTGWRREVLLGKEPNVNANHQSRAGSITGSKGTPRIDPKAPPGSAGSGGSGAANDASAGGGAAATATGANTPGRVQHVFLPELLDDDSAVQFYEDYAKLAWGDSRGQVRRPMRLIKYRPAAKTEELQRQGGRDQHQHQQGQQQGQHVSANGALEEGEGGPVQRAAQKLENGIWSEAGICELGEQEGMVESMCCWSVKRDMFELPMLIVLSFLPIM